MADEMTLAEKLAYWRANPGSLGVDRRHMSKTWVVPADSDGRPTGTQTEHRDGRVDAHVTPRTVKYKIGVQDG